jgi:hypothetical protein
MITILLVIAKFFSF